MSTIQSAAILTIRGASDFTTKGRKQVAAWLRRQAKLLEEHAGDLSHRFTARYLYEAKKPKPKRPKTPKY